MKELIFKVNGMVCEGCENRIKNAIGTLDEIEIVEANHITGIVKVTSNKEIEREREKIEEIIKDIGFEIVKDD